MKQTKKIAKVLFLFALSFSILVLLVFQMPSFGASFEGARLERMRKSPQFIGGRFENTPKQNTDSSLIKNFKLYQKASAREPLSDVPIDKIDPASFKVPPAQGLRTSWFGHASVLSEIDGARMMTDPILSERASPFTFIGPKRFHDAPVPLKDLSGIDFVVISHDHYDHLDMETVKHLAKQGTDFFVGLGVGAHLERWEVPFEQIHEMDWWDEADFKGLKIICTPARHYSGRKKMDNSTLWASWLVKGTKHSLYFSGDTGYAGHFAEIKKKYGPVDMSFLKVGAYGDTWLDIHMSAESAVQAHVDLGAKVMLPVHWATFDLSYHPWIEPMLKTLAAVETKKITLITPRIGEFYEFGKPYSNSKWYEGL